MLRLGVALLFVPRRGLSRYSKWLCMPFSRSAVYEVLGGECHKRGGSTRKLMHTMARITYSRTYFWKWRYTPTTTKNKLKNASVALPRYGLRQRQSHVDRKAKSKSSMTISSPDQISEKNTSFSVPYPERAELQFSYSTCAMYFLYSQDGLHRMNQANRLTNDNTSQPRADIVFPRGQS